MAKDLVVQPWCISQVVKAHEDCPELQAVLDEYHKPVVIQDQVLGELTLDKDYDAFEGEIQWCGKDVSLSLEVNAESKPSWTRARSAAKKLLADCETWDKAMRDLAAKNLTELANNWLSQDEENPRNPETDPITEEELARRISMTSLNATVTDGSFTVREVTIVASLIEKETASASESPRIAGVIYNRLFHWDYPALLNIDAAIIYAQDGVSDHIDTSLDSPYNTYLHVGLTPTPIANPGLASLQAALNPESHNYYYYVLNPATGAHQFSTTQEEHEQYRAQFAAAAAAASTQSEGE